MKSVSLISVSYYINLWADYGVTTNKFEENTQVLSVLYIVVVRSVYAIMHGSVTEREKSDFSSIFN
jgi:hypothetical protein